MKLRAGVDGFGHRYFISHDISDIIFISNNVRLFLWAHLVVFDPNETVRRKKYFLF